jgi:hypothetical protein
MPSEVDQAEHVLNNLRQKRETLVARGHSLGEERTQLAFGAHALGDSKARRRLDEINREDALCDSELRSLDAAISEASVRVERAQQAEARKVAAAKAEELRTLTAELAEVFPYVDRKLAEAADGLIAIEKGFAQLRALGIGPTDVQLRLGLTSVVETWAMRLPKYVHNQLRDGVRFLSPAERRTASDYWVAVEMTLQTAIRQRFGEPPASQPPPKSTPEKAA